MPKFGHDAPKMCKHGRCTRKPFGLWGGGHDDAGYCLKCGVNRWKKRLFTRHPELKGTTNE